MVASAITAGASTQAAPADTAGVALQVALAADVAPLGTLVGANAAVAAAYGPPSSSVTAVDVAAALAGTGVTAVQGTASASADTTDARHVGTSRIDGLRLAVLGSPTSATVLSGTATCPATGAPTAATTVTNLAVLGQAVTATVNGPATTVTSAVTVPGLTDAELTAVVRTNIRNTTADTATATALRIDLTLTADLGGAPISVPVGTITAGTAACQRPARVAPTVTALAPTSGPTAGGTDVTVTGSGFVPGATTVTIGGTTIPAADVRVTAPTTLTFTTPAHAAGPVEVTTTTSAGTSAPQTFRYVPGPLTTPTVTGIRPAAGPTAGGTDVTVTGSGFVPGATTVTIGGTTVPAADVRVTDSTTLTFTTPAHAAGAVDVTASTDGGTSAPVSYRYVPAPTAAGLSPSAGPTTGGTTVVVTGTGFVPGATTVTIGGVAVPADDVTVLSPTRLSFTTPAHALGSVPVIVTTPGGTSAGLAFQYVDAAATTGQHLPTVAG